jgi:hypothetical protein
MLPGICIVSFGALYVLRCPTSTPSSAIFDYSITLHHAMENFGYDDMHLFLRENLLYVMDILEFPTYSRYLNPT